MTLHDNHVAGEFSAAREEFAAAKREAEEARAEAQRLRAALNIVARCQVAAVCSLVRAALADTAPDAKEGT